MSLLNWTLTDEYVTVLTDTLATRDGEAIMFVPKVAAFPHLDMLIGVTGLHDVFIGWQALLTRYAPGLGIDDLDATATAALRGIWEEMHPGGTDRRTTVRHWGWSEKEGRFAGRSFRSTNDFEAEVMPYGVGLSPDPLPEHRDIPVQSFEHMVEIAHGQREQGLREPESERVYVGGWMLAFVMQRAEGGPVTTLAHKVCQFAGFDDDAAAALQARPWGQW